MKFISIKKTIAILSLGLITLSNSYGQKKDIVDTAVKAGKFKTLAAALDAAGLVGTLKGKGPFTVFAPTDAAFAKLPKGTVESLLKPENKDKLVDILTYHVVSGKVPAKVALTLKEATPLNKKKIKLQVRKGSLFLNQSKVTATDINCSNGVIHIIDTVLLPPENKPKKSAPAATASTPMKPVGAKGLINMALHEGGRQYNHHNVRAAEAIYKVAAHALMAMPKDTLPNDHRNAISNAIEKASHSHHSGNNAWTYYQALKSASGH